MRQPTIYRTTHQDDMRPASTAGRGDEPDRSDPLAGIVGAMAPFAGWEIDLPERRVWWSERLLSIFGLAPGAAPNLDQAIDFCLPHCRAQFRAMVDACVRDGTPFDATIEIATAPGRRIALRTIGSALRGPDGAIIRMQGAVREIGQRREAGDDTATLAARLASTLDSMGEAFFTMDTALRFTYLNPQAARLLHVNRAEVLGKLVWDEFKQAVGGTSYREYGRALRERCITSFEEFYPPLACWFEVRCYPTEDGLAVYFHDITERKEARLALRQAHRALQMLSRCNHVLVRAKGERELIGEVCHIAVAVGGYRMAWVGYAEDDEARTISVAAHAGQPGDAAYLGALSLSWAEPSGAAIGPSGAVILRGEPVVVADIVHDSRFAGRMAPAVAHGFKGAIFLPMRDGARTFGLLALYTEHVVAIDDAETGLLKELADNLAFGISNIRARVEQEHTQLAVTKVAASVSASSSNGERFFEQLAATMAEAVGADGGFIARLLPTDPLKARTVIAIVDGVRVADFDYVVGASPCAVTIERNHYVVSSGVDVDFPASPAAACGARAYGGWRLNTASGQTLGIVFVVFRKPAPRSALVASTLQIFAARAAAELERQDADTSLRTQASLLDEAQDAILVRSLDDEILFWNKSAERMYGWTRAEALGRNAQELLRGDPDGFAEAKRQTLETGQWAGEVTRHAKNGDPVSADTRLSLIKNDDGQVHAILSINTDVSQRKAAEREIERLAFYDPLTGLPNRLLLLDRVRRALQITGRGGYTCALLFINVDHFKAINDAFGHDRGDDLLRELAERLRACVYEIDTVARTGGDEFVVLLENLGEHGKDPAARARHICETIGRALLNPVILDGAARHASASIGVTLFDDQRCDPGALLQQAGLAMYEAKAAGRNGVRFFDPEMQRVITARSGIEADLRVALLRNEFLLHYQPQVDHCGRVIGAEALIRWQCASRGLVAPAVFIPVAEETRLILPIGRWVLESACRQLALWARQPHLAALSISVNVSAQQLRQPGFCGEVLGALEQAGADPQRLKLEITESLLVEDSETTIATMHGLKARGVGFSLDDFGTGYSSLSYLKRLPLDQLKIDQSFVRDVLVDLNDAAIAQTILALGNSLGLVVIAEGVETAEQHAFLLEHGCRAFQGYLFSRPLAADRFEDLVEQGALAARHGGSVA